MHWETFWCVPAKQTRQAVLIKLFQVINQVWKIVLNMSTSLQFIQFHYPGDLSGDSLGHYTGDNYLDIRKFNIRVDSTLSSACVCVCVYVETKLYVCCLRLLKYLKFVSDIQSVSRCLAQFASCMASYMERIALVAFHCFPARSLPCLFVQDGLLLLILSWLGRSEQHLDKPL